MDTSSAEKLRSVAQQLVQAREAQGIPLEEIATKTFIPMRILKALEAGETFKLPEPIFVQGFIRRYAKLVGLDGDTLAKEIPLNTQPVAVDLIKEAPRPPLVDVIRNQSSKASVPDKVMRPVVSYGAENSASSRDGGHGRDRPVWLFPVLGGVLGFGLLAAAIAILRPQTPEVKSTNAPSPSTQPIVTKPSPKPSVTSSPIASETPTPSPSVTPSPSITPTPTPSVSSGPVKVDVSLSDASWIEVVVDGEVKFDGTMEKGSTQSWSGQKDVQISSGNAGAVKLVYNQSAATVMGKAGQVETKKFSAKN